MFAEIRDFEGKITRVNLDKIEWLSLTMLNNGHYKFHFNEWDADGWGVSEVTLFNHELKEGGEDETLRD